MDNNEVKEAFKRWWIAENEFWPDRDAEFKFTISRSGHVEILRLPDSLNPLLHKVFTRENGHKYASHETKKNIGQAVNAVEGMFRYIHGPQWQTATMDDFFKKNPRVSCLEERPNLGPKTIQVILAILSGTETNRYD